MWWQILKKHVSSQLSIAISWCTQLFSRLDLYFFVALGEHVKVVHFKICIYKFWIRHFPWDRVMFSLGIHTPGQTTSHATLQRLSHSWQSWYSQSDFTRYDNMSFNVMPNTHVHSVASFHSVWLLPQWLSKHQWACCGQMLDLETSAGKPYRIEDKKPLHFLN